MESNKPIRLALVDDDRLFVELLAEFLNEQAQFEVVLTALDSVSFFKKMHKQDILPEVLLLDLRMQTESGLEVMQQLDQMDFFVKTIVLSTFYKPAFMGQMLRLGADAFIPKDIDRWSLVSVIEEVYYKGHYFLNEQVDVLRSQLTNKSPRLFLPQKDGLTEREISILQLICQQLTTREIADKLCIAPTTVETHKTRLIMKTGVRNSAGLIIYAIQQKLIQPEEFILLEG